MHFSDDSFKVTHVARQPVGVEFPYSTPIKNNPIYDTLSPRWGLGNWLADVLYTYRPAGAL